MIVKKGILFILQKKFIIWQNKYFIMLKRIFAKK